MAGIRISREVTSLREEDTFLIFDRTKKDFSYPLHFHPEYEINFIAGGKGLTRIVGDSVETIGEYELCFVGPNLYHVWKNGDKKTKNDKREVTIQFSKNLFPDELLKKDSFQKVAKLLDKSRAGLKFSPEVAKEAEVVINQILKHNQKKGGFAAYVALLQLIDLMSTARTTQLCNLSFVSKEINIIDERIELIHDYLQKNFNKKIHLEEVAALLNMSNISFMRLIKNRTGKNFVTWLNEIRLGVAARMMIDSNKNISEICFACGFNNISNFNRVFKKSQGLTPSDFRKMYQGKKNIL